jgi:hypothetical protein
MGLTVKINNPEFPEDHLFAINGLGIFENGTAREVTKEEEQAFVDLKGVAARDALSSSGIFEVSGTATAKVPNPPVEEEEDTTTVEVDEENGGED